MPGKQTSISFNLDGLEKLAREIGKSYITRVGVLGSKAFRTDDEPMNNAEIGLIHEFGSVSANIPPRSFLRMPLETKRTDLVKSMSQPNVRGAVSAGQYKKVYQIMGVNAEAIINDAFVSGGFGKWAPNKSATIAAKGSSKPLIDTGQLRRSITSDVVRRGQI